MLKETWSKPEVIEQQIRLEVTSYAPAEIEAA
jgi:coenzyme PQQ precursor peptide PqqA